MSEFKEDLRIIVGGLGQEHEVQAYIESPTWIVDELWDKVQETCLNALDAYMDYCKTNKIPHSFLLGLDVLIMGEVDPKNPNKLIDIRPTLVEGPCCNSYPACPNIWAYRIYKKIDMLGKKPDSVEYPTHPTKILEKMVNTFKNIWKSKGKDGLPRIGVFTRPYPESEEEAAHVIILNALKEAGLEAYRITPLEKPYIKDGKIYVNDLPIDICYRRIERIHVPIFYGDKLGNQIIKETPNTIWINPFEVDDLRSKTLEERCFRAWEAKGGNKISRPTTLIGPEITPENVKKLALSGGFALKKWNSTGGKGVFLHLALDYAKKAADSLYIRYDGRNMILLDNEKLERELKGFENFTEDASIQQLRLPDAREIEEGKKLVYDTRINVLYDPLNNKWEFLSGISRVVPCGKDVTNGNSLLTNITSGAQMAPLVFGYTKKGTKRSHMEFGPLAEALLSKKNEWKIK